MSKIIKETKRSLQKNFKLRINQRIFLKEDLRKYKKVKK